MIQDIIRLLGRQDIVFLTGAAGTGKTHTITEVIQSYRGSVIGMAPTARAAENATRVTGLEFKTIHSCVYQIPEEAEDGTPDFKKIRKLGGRGTLVIVDEISMVGTRLFNSIKKALRPGTKLLLVGDMNQLLPVGDLPYDYGTPDFVLNRVWRNHSGVLKFTQAILTCMTSQALIDIMRNPQGFEGVQRRSMQDILPSQWRAEAFTAGQDVMFLTHRNEVRHQANEAVRARLGFSQSEPLLPGEILCVRTNNYTLNCSNGDLVDFNGFTGEVDADLPVHMKPAVITRKYALPGYPRERECYVVPDEMMLDTQEARLARGKESAAWRERIKTEPTFPTSQRWQDEAALVRCGGFPGWVGPAKTVLHVNYGYCITAHAAQGGQAKNVGVFWDLDWMARKNLDSARRWAYVAASRAEDTVTTWQR